MFTKIVLLLLTTAFALSACSTLEVSLDQTPTPSVDSDEVATIVAATVAAIPSATAAPTATPTPQVPSVLPRSLYYLGEVDSETGAGQIYQLSRDGLTNTQITSESMGVTEFDVSPSDGQLAYTTGSQLILTDANGENHRVLVDNITTQRGLHWSPDGKTIAYVNNGICFYALETNIATLMLSNDETNQYSPDDFSPDGSKLLFHAQSKKLDYIGIYTIASQTDSPLQPSEPAKHQIAYSPSFWSNDSKYIYIAEWAAGGGTHGWRIPGLWRYNPDGTGMALLPVSAADGKSIFNKTAAPWQDTAGQLIYLFSPPETGIDSYSPFSIVRSDTDGISNRTVLRAETFHVTDISLWAADGSAVVIIQNDGQSNRFDNMVLIPVDASKPVVTLLADASKLGSTLRWGP